MGKINIVLDDKVERELRMAIAKQGGKKGDLSKAIENAIKQWLKHQD